jgi:hypothetical protein
MPETDKQRLWRQDSMVLGELGAVLASAELPRVEVRLPRPLGEQAVAAWERDDGEGPLDPDRRHVGGTTCCALLVGCGYGRRRFPNAIICT